MSISAERRTEWSICTSYNHGLPFAVTSFQSEAMRLRRKSAIVVALGTLLLLTACFVYLSSTAPKYRGHVRVSVKPFPAELNTVVAQQFRAHGFRLKKAGPGLAEIIVESRTAEDAKKKGVEATDLLRATAKRNYGAELLLVDTFEEPLHPLTHLVETLNRVIEPPLKRFGIVP